MNGFDLSTVTNIYLGSTPVKEVYMGTKLIWPKTIDYSNEYFTIESLEDGNQIGIINSNKPSISISKDKQTWTTVTPNEAPTYFITLNVGEKVYIKGSNDAYNSNPDGYFTSTGQFNVSGNIMSLIYGDDFKNKTTLPSSNAFSDLFYNASKLISAEHLVLPATTLTTSCYYQMFYGCSSLTTAPELPATTIDVACYAGMFSGCSSLTTATTILPAGYLFGYCYSYMFYGCSSLTTAPELPAFWVSSNCYEHMFEGCTSLTTAPTILPATEVQSECYSNMFSGCSSLTTAPELPATTLAYSCYNNMFYGCSSLTTAPELLATTLAEDCYAGMFSNCSSLNYIKMLATDVSASSCLYWWVHNVYSYGTFIKDASTTLPTGDSGIPDGWTVETA